MTSRYPELAAPARAVCVEQLVLDGEIVALPGAGVVKLAAAADAGAEFAGGAVAAVPAV